MIKSLQSMSGSFYNLICFSICVQHLIIIFLNEEKFAIFVWIIFVFYMFSLYWINYLTTHLQPESGLFHNLICFTCFCHLIIIILKVLKFLNIVWVIFAYLYFVCVWSFNQKRSIIIVIILY